MSREERLAKKRQRYLANRERLIKEAAEYRAKQDPDERRAKRRQSYLAHRDKNRRYSVEYRAKNLEKIKAYQAVWYAAKGAGFARKRYHRNPQASLAAARKWCSKNPEYHRKHALAAYYEDVEAGRTKCRAYRASDVRRHRQRFVEWAKQNPHKVRDIARRRRARKLAATTEQFDETEIFERDGWACYICYSPVSTSLPAADPARAILEHVVSLANGGAHSRANVRCACFRCNAMKGAHLTPDQVRDRLQAAGVDVKDASKAAIGRPEARTTSVSEA